MNDEELLAHLKATDPALTSKAPRPDVPRLVEATMNTTTAGTTPVPATAKDRAPRHRLVPALAFTALLLTVGGGITWGVAQGGEDTKAQATSPAATTTPGAHPRPQPKPLTLTLPDSGSMAASCVVPTPDLLRRHQLAFEGTVIAEQEDRVTLSVDHWYRATTDPADRPTEVRLTNDEAYAEAPAFEIGGHYLVTAENGTVPMCGGTTEATDEARAMFEEAF
ncbi:hypothetical protein PV396_18935 [Streptomyces sp. ME02-8801-2C]|uniref:hypothetical protein n=1 Tax=Streptomyces sp. ME02-8801-2C TaxID=3028680 RepID=UPI0029B532FA|nr:hypothetical protein [Streptomyces sp. ME02-8801-2C]MDX3453997.1 hypothetical protein [Streptomyces sp. ME02-8801-2C]